MGLTEVLRDGAEAVEGVEAADGWLIWEGKPNGVYGVTYTETEAPVTHGQAKQGDLLSPD